MSELGESIFRLEIKDGVVTHHCPLTSRELFAAMAMQSLLNRARIEFEAIPHPDKDRNYTRAELVSRWAVSYADELLAELAKGDK